MRRLPNEDRRSPGARVSESEKANGNKGVFQNSAPVLPIAHQCVALRLENPNDDRARRKLDAPGPHSRRLSHYKDNPPDRWQAAEGLISCINYGADDGMLRETDQFWQVS